jgi:hypothetical protein
MRSILTMLKFKKIYLAFLLLVLFPCFALALDYDQEEEFTNTEKIAPYPKLDIDVWVDKGEGGTYHPGQEIGLYFQTSADCYVAIYNIDTRGYLNILYPYESSDPQFVRGGKIYRIPGRYDDYQLTVDGPEGTEYIVAVASFEPIRIPSWPRYAQHLDDMGGIREDNEINVTRLEEDEDPYDFIEFVNNWMIPDDYYVTDLCLFNVECPQPRWYYWPNRYYIERPWYYDIGAAYIWSPFEAEVYIDGVFYGITPITIPYLIVGRHFVTIYYHGCRMWWDWVSVHQERMVTVQPHFNDRYRFVVDDPIQKEYRIRKEKEIRTYDADKANRRREVVKARKETRTFERETPVQTREIKSKSEEQKQRSTASDDDKRVRNGSKSKFRSEEKESQRPYFQKDERLRSAEKEKEKLRAKEDSDKGNKVMTGERKTEKASDRPGKDRSSVNKNPRPEKSMRRR